MVDCPHCFLRVIPMKDGRCPSCRADTTIPRTDGRLLLEISEKANLPKLCCTCGQPCERRIRLKSVRQIGGNEKLTRQEAGEFPLLFWWLFLGPLSLALKYATSGGGRGGERKVVVEVTVPQCLPCSKASPLEPIRVDYDFFRMDLAAAKEFIAEFRKLNAKPAQ